MCSSDLAFIVHPFLKTIVEAIYPKYFTKVYTIWVEDSVSSSSLGANIAITLFSIKKKTNTPCPPRTV